MSLRETFKTNRPKLADSSINTYVSIVNNLFKRMDGKGDIREFFGKNIDKVLDFLSSKPYNLRKTTLAVLVSLLGDKAEKYRDQMLLDAKQYQKDQEKQEPTEKQTKNWEKWSEITDKANKYYKTYYPLLNKDKLSNKDKELLMDMIILQVYTLIPPRRSKDYVDFKIRNINKDTDNYMEKNKFVFNSYKTNGVYGKQEVTIPRKLQLLIKKWAGKIESDYLLFNKNNNKISVSQLTLKLNKIFGKNLSTSLLRHIFISDVTLKAAPALKEMQKVASEMGHSTQQQQMYRLLVPENK
jgi:hypothetical protein